MGCYSVWPSTMSLGSSGPQFCQSQMGITPPVLEEGNRHISEEMMQMKGNENQRALNYHLTAKKKIKYKADMKG